MRTTASIEAVHSCGHGPIAGSVVAAALALAEHARPSSPAALVVIGCPADEIHAPGTVARGGGKLLSVEAGLWDGVDVALYSHPEFIDTVTLESRWMRRERARLDRCALAARRAAQAPLLAAQALIAAAERTGGRDGRARRVRRRRRGGHEPDLQADLLLFADTEAELEERCAEARARRCPTAPGRRASPTAACSPTTAVTASVREAFAAAGRGFEADPPALPFATDFGNISQRRARRADRRRARGGWAFHTDEGREQFASEAGFEAAITTARVLALSAARLTEPTS